MRADARGRKVGAPRLLALGRRHRLGALQPRPPPRPREPGVAGARPLRALQGPRGPDPVRGARPPRLLPARGPPGPAEDRSRPAGAPRHDSNAGRRGLDRLARPGTLDVRGHLPRAAPRRARRHGAGVRRALRRRLPGGSDLGGGDGRGALRRRELDRDRRLQPPPDRRHDRGGHGHRRRAGEVRVVRLGLDRDRRPRHGRRSSRRWSAAAPSTGPRRSSRRPRRAAASRRWRAASASTASRRRPEQAGEALDELDGAARGADRGPPRRRRRRR